MYPAPSNWRTSEPYAAWFVLRQAGAEPTVCQTSGTDFLLDLEGELRARIGDVGLAVPDGSGVVRAADVPFDAARGWTRGVLRGLLAVAAADRAPARYAQALAADLRGGTVSPDALRAAVWLAELSARSVQGSDERRYGYGSPDEVELPATILLPQLDAPLPAPLGGGGSGLQCRPLAGLPAPPPALNLGATPWYFNPLVVLAFAAGAVAVGAALTRKVPARGRRRS